jgi:hypothetical protein
MILMPLKIELPPPHLACKLLMMAWLFGIICCVVSELPVGLDWISLWSISGYLWVLEAETHQESQRCRMIEWHEGQWRLDVKGEVFPVRVRPGVFCSSHWIAVVFEGMDVKIKPVHILLSKQDLPSDVFHGIVRILRAEKFKHPSKWLRR